MSIQTLAPKTPLAATSAKVARTALAVLLFLQGGILALWALSWAATELSDHGILHVSYPAWAGAALWVVLFGAAVRATVIAGVAMWQSAWGPVGKITAGKVNAAWAAVAVNAALVPGLALVATVAGSSPEAADIKNLFWFVVWGGAIAAGLAFCSLRPPMRWAGWRHVAKAVVACAILLLGAGIMFQDQRIGFADSLRTFFLPGHVTSGPRPGVPNAGCAGRAARTAGTVIAWAPAPAGYSTGPSEAPLFVDGHSAVESLRSTGDGTSLHLSSNQTGGRANPCKAGACTHRLAVHANHQTIVVRSGFATDQGNFAYASWKRGREQFSLVIAKASDPVDVAWFTQVLRSVQYAAP